MKSEVDSERQDIFDHMADDLAKDREEDAPIRRRKSAQGSRSAGGFTLLLGLGAAILVLFMILLLRGSDKQDLTPLETRLGQVENRLAMIDDNLRKLEALEDNFKSLEQTQAKLESTGKTMDQRLNTLAKRVEKAQVSAAAPRAAAQPKTTVHEVRRGDTLFGIAAKYGVNLDQLLKLNNLSKNATLQPGQKIVIAPSGP